MIPACRRTTLRRSGVTLMGHAVGASHRQLAPRTPIDYLATATSLRASVHELSIAQSVLDIVDQNLPKDRPVRVRAVRLRIGAMGGVVTDSLEFCFSAITRGTRLEGVPLEIEHVPLVVHCRSCGKDSVIEQTLFACPACEAADLHMVSGNEMHVSEIEIDDDGALP